MHSIIKEYLRRRLNIIDYPYKLLEGPTKNLFEIRKEGVYLLFIRLGPHHIIGKRVIFPEGYYEIDINDPLSSETLITVREIPHLKQFALEKAVENEDYEIAAQIRDLDE